MKQNIKSLFSLIKTTKPRYLLLLMGIILGGIGTLITISIPKFAQTILNGFKKGIDPKIVGILVIVFIASAVINSLAGYVLGVFGESVVRNLREVLWTRTLSLKIPYFKKQKSGELTSRIVNDANQVKDLLATALPEMITSLIQLIGVIAIMFTMDVTMSLVILLSIPLLLIILWPIMVFAAKVGKERQKDLASLNGTSQEIINEITLVKSNAAEDKERKRGLSLINRLFRLGKKEAAFYSVTDPTIDAISMAVFLGILAYGVFRISAGTLTIGTMFAFLMYVFQIMGPVNSLGDFADEVALTIGSTQRIREILQEPKEKYSGKTAELDSKNTLTFNHVSFSYNGKKKVLNDVSLNAKPNQITALVGPSGSGKSTIFNLIERFYEPQSGTIKFGNENINNFRLQEWRKQIGYVNQNSSILSGTIKENLEYGSGGEYSDEQIWQALKMANAYEFVKKEPKQLATQVGEHGSYLSGGQVQRLTIARAFLKNPKILLLDEATANLDAYSEVVVEKALRNLMKNRTTLVIAHRLSTIKHADNIYFVDHGKIMGNGTNDELIKLVPKYREFVDLQLR